MNVRLMFRKRWMRLFPCDSSTLSVKHIPGQVRVKSAFQKASFLREGLESVGLIGFSSQESWISSVRLYVVSSIQFTVSLFPYLSHWCCKTSQNLDFLFPFLHPDAPGPLEIKNDDKSLILPWLNLPWAHSHRWKLEVFKTCFYSLGQDMLSIVPL